ncbi:hypothetical protein JCGZ_14020 [Jatropha curcas]|uniref:Pentacotripeptide-repeat region of PRORP domain-containing protein n=1 Tax=Jatropha curcas TaxID=180498 RepID=A0A067K8Y3_JATCU|nr:pentatricopeptide repeat-containing protein At3g62470, mitochondrial [Jatropha curcas]KDP28249.1 hypothetical protein JCGZ_14020 [Jatropha curcas]
MFFSLKRPGDFSILLHRCLQSQTQSSFHGQIYSAEKLFYLQERGAGKRCRGEQVCLPGCSSLPWSRLFYSSSHRSLYHSYCQVPFILPHSSPLDYLQEKLSLATKSRFIINIETSLLSSFYVQGKFSELTSRGFSCFTGGGADSDAESDGNNDSDIFENDNGGGNVKSSADPVEVNRVCKVIDELFALDRNMEAVLDECGINLSQDLVIDVLERFRHARKPAFRFFCWAGQKQGFAHDSRTYNSMMSILAKTRQFETMISMLEEIGEKGLLTMETFSIAMRAFAVAKERKKAVAIFELMKKHKYKVGVETINSLLDSLGRSKLGKEAEVLFGKLIGRFTPNLKTYTVLLNGWCKVKNLMEAGRIWNEMIDKGFKPDIVAHNIMLEGLLRSKKMSDAVKFFMVMKAKGPSPDVQSYTILIRHLGKQSKMEEAMEYFDEMIDSGCKPDRAVYTCLITGFGKQKRMDMVYDLLKEMKEKGCPPDGQTYNALIKLMTSRKRPDDALIIYNKMLQSGNVPTIHTYNMILKSYFQTGNYEMGRQVWDEMIGRGCCLDDNSYTVFIGGLISQGRSGEACKYLEEMLNKGMKAPHLDYTKFVADFSRVGKPDILEELAQKMKFAGKDEVSNVLASWAEMMKKKFKRRDFDY